MSGLHGQWAAGIGTALVLLALSGALPGGPDSGGSSDRAEAFEVGPGELAQLPRGKEADGIRGDFVLRNGLVEALVAGNFHDRRANMSTFYNAPVPGCLLDLSVRGSGNDQLTCLQPGGLEGLVSSVRVAADGSDPSSPAAVVRVERTAALGGGIRETHEYRLAPGDRHLLIVSTYENLGRAAASIKPEAAWKGLSGEVKLAGIRAADAMDPQDRQGYAVAAVRFSGAEPDEAPFTLKPGERRVVALAVAPGRSPADALGVIAALRGPTGLIRGRVHGPSGRPVLTASVDIPLGEKMVLAAYPGPGGEFEARLPPGDYELSARDLGRPTLKSRAAVVAGGAAEARFDMAQESRIAFEISGADGESLPCKAQFSGIAPTKDPDLGVTIRAHGCKNQYHSETGWFTVAVPPGKYRVVVTRGIEFDHHEAEVDVREGREARVRATLRRLVDSRGWVSTDFHSHSTPSGDNYCGTDDRIINLAAEGIEFAPTTEHNRFYDWAPHIRRLHLEDELSTAVGIELTGPGPHLNAFPFRLSPGTQDGGAPAWVRDPRINAITLRDLQGGHPDRWVQLNHPAVGEFFRDRNADGVPDGGYPDLERFIDSAEVWSAEVLNLKPIISTTDATTGKSRRIQNRTFAWMQLLNQGRRMWCVAVSDAHGVFNDGAGGWRTYVPSSTDEPARIDFREIARNARAGRSFVTNGPFLEAALADGTPPGGSTIAPRRVELRVRVQTNRWVKVDRLQVLVNGRARPELNFTRAARADLFRDAPGDPVKFEETIPVSLTEDSWLIAVAFGEGADLKGGYGSSWQAALHPCAFHNPIYVDIDGDGFRPNGDTLDHPLPAAFPIRRSF